MVVPAIMRLDRECLQGWEEGEKEIVDMLASLYRP